MAHPNLLTCGWQVPDVCCVLIVLVTLQMADLSTHTANVWRTLADSSPQFVADHVLAVGLWLLFYAAECSGHDAAARAGNRSLRGQMALVPKVLVPLDFKGVAQAWLQSPYFKRATGKYRTGKFLKMVLRGVQISMNPDCSAHDRLACRHTLA